MEKNLFSLMNFNCANTVITSPLPLPAYIQDGFPDFQDAVQSFYQQDSVKLQQALSKGKCEDLAALGSQVNPPQHILLHRVFFHNESFMLEQLVIRGLSDLAGMTSFLLWVLDF